MCIFMYIYIYICIYMYIYVCCYINVCLMYMQVCRYTQMPEAQQTGGCMHCGEPEDLWMCLICGFMGCKWKKKKMLAPSDVHV